MAFFLITITKRVTVLNFQLQFTSEPGAASLFTAYWDGSQVGLLDERYAPGALQAYSFSLPAAYDPGTYTLAFRLDPLTTFQSSVAVSNISTAFVSNEVFPDLDGDGTVGFGDLLVVAQNFGNAHASLSDGDFNHDGVVDFADLLLLAQDYGMSRLAGPNNTANITYLARGTRWSIEDELASHKYGHQQPPKRRSLLLLEERARGTRR